MSSFVKAKLKTANDAIRKKDYEAASEAARGVLDYEPENYMAYVGRTESVQPSRMS